MTIELNHTVVPSRDKHRSAAFLARSDHLPDRPLTIGLCGRAPGLVMQTVGTQLAPDGPTVR